MNKEVNKELNNTVPITKGVHHVGLTVAKLEESARFFVDVLGWSEVRRDLNYPAIFVKDDAIMVTLWEAKSDSHQEFDKNNPGLHHLALAVKCFDDLDSIYNSIVEYGLAIEFSPELLRNGPAKHMICYEPSGIRIEFICVPE